MGGGSRPSAPPPPPPEPPKPVDVAPARTAAETSAAYKKARRGRSAGLMSATTSETLGTDTTLGAS
jgi:hypothetical protein